MTQLKAKFHLPQHSLLFSNSKTYFDISPPTHNITFHLQPTPQSTSSNTHCDFLLQYTALPQTHTAIFLQHSSPSLGSHKAHHIMFLNLLPVLWSSFSKWSQQCEQKKQMEWFPRPHGMWNVGIVYISPCHWSVSMMKFFDWWARSQWEQVQPLPQPSPTHKVWGGAALPG
jgi:hypothetical protein